MPTKDSQSVILHRHRFAEHTLEAPGLHFATAEFRAGAGHILHDHDFHELFWVMSGTGWHVFPGGRVLLAPGDAAFIAPRTAHGFASDPGRTFAIMNVVIADPHVRRLRRWLRAEGLRWPWHKTPVTARLEDAALRRLTRLLADTPIPGTALDRDRLLFGILAELLRDRRPAPESTAAPPWLTRAVERLREDPSGGVQALVRACGRSREHVARSVRRCYETTPSTLANHLRCDLAARRLRLTTATIVTIAQEVGFADLAHFYRCFTARHGCPPNAYRRTHRAPV